LPGTDQILAEIIQARGEILHYECHEPVHSILNKVELTQQWKESIIEPIYKKSVNIYYNNY
jgi:hypothetical protein